MSIFGLVSRVKYLHLSCDHIQLDTHQYAMSFEMVTELQSNKPSEYVSIHAAFCSHIKFIIALITLQSASIYAFIKKHSVLQFPKLRTHTLTHTHSKHILMHMYQTKAPSPPPETSSPTPAPSPETPQTQVSIHTVAVLIDSGCKNHSCFDSQLQSLFCASLKQTRPLLAAKHLTFCTLILIQQPTPAPTPVSYALSQKPKSNFYFGVICCTQSK